jgi:pectinesterase
MKSLKKLFLVVATFSFLTANAQILDHSWREIVNTKNEAFFQTDTAKIFAENVLLYQRDIGGWPKNQKINRVLTVVEKAEINDEKYINDGCTIDNGATYLELIYLSRIYKYNPDPRYKEAFLKGVNYLLQAQYKNGGWPQFYPLHKGYSTHITFNDDAMDHVLEILHNIATDNGVFTIPVDEKTRKACKKAFDKGIDCILKAQWKQNGVLTGWCAQVDEVTLQPAGARSYELPSLSGQESAGLVLILMEIENPSKKVKEAVDAAVAWFEKTKITGLRQERYYTPEGLREKRLIEDPIAPPMWARFMELDTNRPFFCDRDGVKKYSMMEIGQERRNGYGWYSYAPQEVLDKYPEWKKKHD